MHPKTFQVVVRRPLSNYESYHLYLHAQDWREALAKVLELFPGVNVEPTIRRYETRGHASGGIGNTDPVWLMDCDVFRNRRRVAGKFVLLPTEAGAFRRGIEAVAQDLWRVFQQMGEARSGHLRSFETLRREYEMGPPRQWVYERMLECKSVAEQTLTWQDRVWAEYRRLEACRQLELPEAVHALRRAA